MEPPIVTPYPGKAGDEYAYGIGTGGAGAGTPEFIPPDGGIYPVVGAGTGGAD